MTGPTKLALAAAVILIVVAGVLISRPPPKSGKTPSVPVPVTDLIAAAQALEKEGKWCDAERKWDEVLRNDDAEPEQRQTALESHANARAKCHPGKPPAEQIDVPPRSVDERPPPVPVDDVTRFYAVGKTVRSVILVNITGIGDNTAWTFKRNAHFAYQYRLEVETKVVENRGTAVRFEQFIPVASQLRAESHQEIELHLPDSPILNDIIWPPIDALLRQWPKYVYVRRGVEIINVVDPRLKRTLTSFNNQLKYLGIRITPDDDIPITVRPEQFAGMRFEIEYVSGLGVTQIKVLDGKKLDPDTLTQLAHRGSLFMDYYVAEGNRKPIGESFDISAGDVSGLWGWLLDVKTSGKLTLRKKSEADRDGEAVSILEVVGGEVNLEGTEDGIHRSGHIRPKPGGFVRYSEPKLLVRLAKMSWQADAQWFSTDHLLFGTEGMRDVKMETYYEADLAKEPE